jgi:hypothetical protein
MSNISGNGPEGNKPQGCGPFQSPPPPEETFSLGACVGGCVFLVLLIIAGIGAWNYWRAGIERQAKQKVDRWIQSIEAERMRIGQEQMRNSGEQIKRNAEQLKRFVEELRRSQNPR